MKIEKVNENQIRCTLTKEDLASRQLKISELAYGTEKAKSLFRDMMQQANFEFGFEAEDIPLMIEAVPINSECIVLIITKVEDPEELDTRFSRFAPSVHEDSDREEDIEALDDASDEILDLFRKIQESDIPIEEPTKSSSDAPASEENEKPLLRLFSFGSLRPLLTLTTHLKQVSFTSSSLYKDNKTNEYLLLLSSTKDYAPVYNKLCNLLSEYGSLRRVLPTTPAYLAEHCSTVIVSDALMVLSHLSSKNN